MDVSFFSHVKKSNTRLLIGCIVFLTREMSIRGLWLAKDNKCTKIYYMEMQRVNLDMYIINSIYTIYPIVLPLLNILTVSQWPYIYFSYSIILILSTMAIHIPYSIVLPLTYSTYHMIFFNPIILPKPNTNAYNLIPNSLITQSHRYPYYSWPGRSSRRRHGHSDRSTSKVHKNQLDFLKTFFKYCFPQL